MAQKTIIGLTGLVTMPGLSHQECMSVTINAGAELLDVSAYGGSGWRQRVAGIKDMTGSAVAFMQEGASQTNPFGGSTTPGTMTILFDVGCTITFPAVIGNVQIQGTYQGLNLVTFNWAFSDPVSPPTVAWTSS